MKIIVFGASKGVGRECVKLAVQRGHLVTAFARSQIQPAPQVGVIQGDVLEPEAVKRAMVGHDAVICALGAGNTDVPIRSQGTRNIVAAMQAQGPRRLVCISSFAVGDSRKGIFANLVWLFLGKALAEHERQEAAIRASDLDWTIIRPTRLMDGPAKGSYQSGEVRLGFGAQVTRADVADFALQTLEQATFLRQAPSISD